MAIVANINNIASSNNSNNSKELPRSEYWLNFGIMVNDKFVSLNKGGVPLDRIEEMRVNAKGDSDSDWNVRATAHNQLVKALNKIASGLDWGEHKRLQLQVELIKINEPNAKNPELANLPSVDDLAISLVVEE